MVSERAIKICIKQFLKNIQWRISWENDLQRPNPKRNALIDSVRSALSILTVFLIVINS